VLRSLIVAGTLALSGCFLVGYDARHEPGGEEDGGMDAAIDDEDAGDDGGVRDAAPDAMRPDAGDAGRRPDAGDAGGRDRDASLMDGGPNGTMDASIDLDAGTRDASFCPDGGCAPLACDGGSCDGTCRAVTAFDGKLDCTYDCRDTASCNLACGTGANCRSGCTDVDSCRAGCASGSSCEVLCTDVASCRADCFSGGGCALRCDHATCEAVHCYTGSACALTCVGAVCRDVYCYGGASCSIACSDSDCGFALCPSGEMRCPDNSVVCNRACPK